LHRASKRKATEKRKKEKKGKKKKGKKKKKKKNDAATLNFLNQDNLFEFHFTIRGAKGSDFEGGIYHGRILLPHNYPLKPPSIVFETPNGRFDTGMKICLTVSAHHPEQWMPSWSIRTVLTAIVGFMESPSGGAIGGLDYSKEVRQKLAKESVDWTCPTCKKTNADLLPLIDDALETSGSDLTTSVASLMDDQSKFPASAIVIEKIVNLDDPSSPAAASEVRRRVPVLRDPTTEETVEQKPANNNNDAAPAAAAVPVAAAAPPVVVAAAVTAAPAGSSAIDLSIAAVFFFLLYLALNRWVVVN
jgi:ubiquitin-conjugating enzyme E2 J1